MNTDNIESLNDLENDIYKDAPGLDPEFEWEEEEYWLNIMMKERFEKTFEAVLSTNKSGEVRNLLITDNEPDFLNNALRKCSV